MSWIIFSSRSSKPGKRLCANGNASAARHARGPQKFQYFTNSWFGGIGASPIAGALQCLAVLVPLAVMGGAQAFAFPNVGLNLQQAIQKQNNALNKPSEGGGFEFGILGSVEFKTVKHRFQSDWQGVIARIKDETDVYERCSVSAIDCPPKVRQWRNLLRDLKGLPVKVQLARLNKSINRMATYADDEKTFGKQDYWATPLEFLSGKADCEDYATVKFWSLLELGYSNDQLRMAVVRDRRRGIMHAVVTVDTGDRKIVLDSLFDYPVEQKYVLKYAPVYSANLDNNWVHIVTRKIRASYVNQLENRAKGLVYRVKAKKRLAPAARPARGPVGIAARGDVTFIDWWA